MLKMFRRSQSYVYGYITIIASLLFCVIKLLKGINYVIIFSFILSTKDVTSAKHNLFSINSYMYNQHLYLLQSLYIKLNGMETVPS